VKVAKAFKGRYTSRDPVLETPMPSMSENPFAMLIVEEFKMSGHGCLTVARKIRNEIVLPFLIIAMTAMHDVAYWLKCLRLVDATSSKPFILYLYQGITKNRASRIGTPYCRY